MPNIFKNNLIDRSYFKFKYSYLFYKTNSKINLTNNNRLIIYRLI